jgi:hypothetical protein
MTPLEQASAILKVAEEIVAADARTLGGAAYALDGSAFTAKGLAKTAPALARALIEKHRALEEAVGLLDAIVDYCPPARDEWMSNTAYLEYADFYNRVSAFLARQGETA